MGYTWAPVNPGASKALTWGDVIPHPRPGPPLLTDQQQAAIEAVSGPVVIHAGAGTGRPRSSRSGLPEPPQREPWTGRALLLTFTDRGRRGDG